MSGTTATYIDVNTAGTLYGLFLERVRRSPEAEAYHYYDPATQTWRASTWSEMAEQVARWQAALRAEPLEVGDRVAIMLRNCREWVMFDQAALSLGLVVVPIYNDDRAENAAYTLRNAGARLLLIEGQEQWNKLSGVRQRLGDVQRIVCLECDLHGARDERLRGAGDWLPMEALQLAPHNLDPDALATITYTSATTGPPKGVMLSHRNVLTNAENSLRTARSDVDHELFLSFLPLSHALERTVGYYVPMMAGYIVAHARSIAQLGEDLRTVRPTALIAVPRVFDRVQRRIDVVLARRPVVRALFDAAVAAGWQRFLYQQGHRPWGPMLLLEPLLRRLVGRKVLQPLGGRLHLVITGGAAMPYRVARTFLGLGVTMLQGYGLTECSPVVSVNRFERNDPTSVGLPIPDTEVRVTKQDELLVHGPNVMMGYWTDPEATALKIDSEGWLHTGDKGRLRDGFVYITGRLKAIIVLDNGEKAPPADMEAAIAKDPLIHQVMVIGEHRPYLAALVVLHAKHWQAYSAMLGLGKEEPAARHRRRQQIILDRIGERLNLFPGYARIRKVAICDEPWSLRKGLLAIDGKPNRHIILEHHRDKVAAIYGDEGHIPNTDATPAPRALSKAG